MRGRELWHCQKMQLFAVFRTKSAGSPILRHLWGHKAEMPLGSFKNKGSLPGTFFPQARGVSACCRNFLMRH